MKFSSNEQQSDILDLNVIPLVDIVFLLLIFFMISTTFADNGGIHVDLPSAGKTAADSQKTELLTVSINKSGEIFYKDSKTSIAELKELFSSVSEKTKQLVIRADTMATHGSVVAVMDAAQAGGIAKIAIATDSK